MNERAVAVARPSRKNWCLHLIELFKVNQIKVENLCKSSLSDQFFESDEDQSEAKKTISKVYDWLKFYEEEADPMKHLLGDISPILQLDT